MKTIGIIAEYNPFHNGHLYQIKEAKRLCNADYCVIVMSGSFVQRGTPAFIDKMTRTEMALKNGADLVLELPVRYSTGSAEFFSTGAIALLNNLGIIHFLCFGSESGNILEMKKIADYIQKDCDEFNNCVQENVKNGHSFPKSRQISLEKYCNFTNLHTIKNIISSPNNILGIEYLKALSFTHSNIEPITIKRKQTGYHDPSLRPALNKECSIHSATAIRTYLEHFGQKNDLEKIRQSVPASVFELLRDTEAYPVTASMLSDMLYYVIATSSIESLSAYLDVTADLARSMKNKLSLFESFEQYITVLKSKQYTYTRISRCFIHILLGIRSYSIKEKTSVEIAPYARILGFQKDASILLKEAKKMSSIPLITKMADAKDILDHAAYEMLCEDIFATDLYHRLIYQAFQVKRKNDIQTTPILL